MGIKTVITNDGEVYTGKEVHKSTSFADIVTGIATCGLSEVLDSDTVTVRVNNEEHSGKKID